MGDITIVSKILSIKPVKIYPLQRAVFGVQYEYMDSYQSNSPLCVNEPSLVLSIDMLKEIEIITVVPIAWIDTVNRKCGVDPDQLRRFAYFNGEYYELKYFDQEKPTCFNLQSNLNFMRSFQFWNKRDYQEWRRTDLTSEPLEWKGSIM